MKDKTTEAQDDAREMLEGIENGSGITVTIVCFLVGAIAGALFGRLYDPIAGVIVFLGSFIGLMLQAWTLIYARRTWMLSRASFKSSAGYRVGSGISNPNPTTLSSADPEQLQAELDARIKV